MLDYAVSQAEGLRVLRSRGAESEVDLPFAGLADLLGPILGYLGALHGRRRAALAGALAVGPQVPADRFAVRAATLGLLAAAAEDRPVLAVVDDAQWLDAASARTVEFTARRLGTEGIGLVVAIREGVESSFDPARMDSVRVTGLGREAARELLARTDRPVTGPVADQLADGVGGNPLALLELSATLTEEQLSGLVSLPEPLPVDAALRRAFTQRLAAAGPGARWLLLLAAANATADLFTVQRAARLLPQDLGGLAAAEESGLVRIEGGRVEFTHPLLRSAAYHSASPADRRAAHRALVEATDPGREPVRRAWHLAAAAVGPDEGVAASLDLAAGVARARNAYIAASRASQRAAELTADPSRQVPRWMGAGQTAHLGGDLGTAARLLRRAAERAAHPCVRADAQAMLAQAVIWAAPVSAHHDELVAEAEAVLPFDQLRAATLLALAASFSCMTGRLSLALETATRAAGLCRRGDGIPWLLSQTWLAYASILTGNRAAGRQLIAGIRAHPLMGAPFNEQAAPGYRAPVQQNEQQVGGGPGGQAGAFSEQAIPGYGAQQNEQQVGGGPGGQTAGDPATHLLQMLCGHALMLCEEYRAAANMLQPSVNNGRALGRVADLPYGLAALSDLRFRTGEWSRAYADAAEGVELGADFATPGNLCYALVCAARVEAAKGAAQACRDHLGQALGLARSAGAESVATYAAAALGLLELGRANYDDATAELARAASLAARHGLGDPNVVQWRPDFIESLARTGRVAEAREQLAVLEAEAATTGSRWAKTAAARCRGLLQGTPQRAIAEFEQAIAAAETSPSAFEQARARLCLGEALRRARRRRDARHQLDQAYTAFELLGARPWADRAAAELAGSGITAAPRRTPVYARLTPQELRVALQVAEGLSNREAASRLFLSPKTIEVHLGHIYDKLGVRSRTSLARLINSGAINQ